MNSPEHDITTQRPHIRSKFIAAILASSILNSTGPVRLEIQEHEPGPPSAKPPWERTPEDLERLARAQARRERKAARRAALFSRP